MLMLLPSPFPLRYPRLRLRLVKQGETPSPSVRLSSFARSACRQACYCPWLSLARLLLVLVCVCLSHVCFADYTVAYTSEADSVTITGPNGQSWHKSYSGTASYGGTWVSANPPPRPGQQSVASTGSVVCSGQITATISWQGTGERPKCVVIKETATASWSGTSGEAHDGLGGSATGSESGSCTTVKYSAKQNPEASFPLHCSPSANASLPTQTDILAATAGVSYKVEVLPVFITRNGQPATDPTNKVLPGEPNALVVSAGGLTQSGHSWSVSGNIMDDFDVVNHPSDQDQSHGRKLPVTQFNYPSCLFYYAGGEGIKTVSCTLTIAGISVTVDGELNLAQPVIDVLSSGWGSDDLADVRFNPMLPAVPSAVGLLPNPNSTVAEDQGIVWAGQLHIPDGWSLGGSLCTAQLVNLSRTYRDTNGIRWVHRRNGQKGHDGSFPYQMNEFSIDSVYAGVDSPQIDLSGTTEATVGTETFQTYLMFKPSMTGSRWVPLKQFSWGWSASATLSPPWSLSNAGKYKTGWLTAVEHPLWEFAVLGDDFIQGN